MAPGTLAGVGVEGGAAKACRFCWPWYLCGPSIHKTSSDPGLLLLTDSSTSVVSNVSRNLTQLIWAISIYFILKTSYTVHKSVNRHLTAVGAEHFWPRNERWKSLLFLSPSSPAPLMLFIFIHSSNYQILASAISVIISSMGRKQ